MTKYLLTVLCLFGGITILDSCEDRCKQNPDINRELGWYPFQVGNYWLSFESRVQNSNTPFRMEIESVEIIHIDEISETLTIALFKMGPLEIPLGSKYFRLGTSDDGNRLYSVPLDLRVGLDASNVILQESSSTSTVLAGFTWNLLGIVPRAEGCQAGSM